MLVHYNSTKHFCVASTHNLLITSRNNHYTKESTDLNEVISRNDPSSKSEVMHETKLSLRIF